MGRTLAAALALFSLLALLSPREGNACERCKFAGSACGIDSCSDAWICEEVHIGGSGWNDCDTSYDACSTGGGLCQWASMSSPAPLGKKQFLALLSHEDHS